MKKYVKIYEKYFNGWLSPARRTLEREAVRPQCYISQIEIKKENQIF
jgi:hypothetical protein